MNVIVTGMNGTVAPFVARDLELQGHTVIPWDRTKISTEDETQIIDFIKASKADFIYHIGMGSPYWTRIMADYCLQKNKGFVFTSTVNVLVEKNEGPYAPDAVPYAADSYGLYKIECENAIREVNPNAHIVRLGWQIGTRPGSNNMIDYFYKQMQENGIISVSKEFYPASSFLWDTSKALIKIAGELEPDIYHLDSNTGYSLYEIAEKLLQYYPELRLKENSDFKRNDLMTDPRINIPWNL